MKEEMKNLLLVLVCTTAVITSNAQNKLSALLELGGPGILSINAEYAVFQKENYQVNLRAGFGYVPSSIAESISIPVEGNFVYRLKNRHHIEAGMVVAYTEGFPRVTTYIGEKVTFEGSALYGSPSIGYRYEPIKSGLILRISYTPMIVLHDYFDTAEIDEAYISAMGEVIEYPDFFVPTAKDNYGWLGLSIGYRF
jgi:hypothetical protein